jgi:hypothetical protein
VTAVLAIGTRAWGWRAGALALLARTTALGFSPSPTTASPT